MKIKTNGQYWFLGIHNYHISKCVARMVERLHCIGMGFIYLISSAKSKRHVLFAVTIETRMVDHPKSHELFYYNTSMTRWNLWTQLRIEQFDDHTIAPCIVTTINQMQFGGCYASYYLNAKQYTRIFLKLFFIKWKLILSFYLFFIPFYLFLFSLSLHRPVVNYIKEGLRGLN